MSHGGLLGTSRPCHYSVLVDENKMGPDVIQQLTNNLAYIYPRSTRSVSIVSPAYFAHHVATRARAHIGADIDDDQSVIFSELSSGKETALRDQKLQAARERLRNIHVNLENTMYFMVSCDTSSGRRFTS
jgi:eukaryotic translation initiation factor 2C